VTATVPSSRRPRRLGPLLIGLAFVVAACSDGESAIDAGRDDAPTTEVTADATEPAEVAPSTDEIEPAATEPAETDVGATDSTVVDAESTATDAPVSPLADSAPCPVDALDAADGPTEITLWFGLADALGSELEALAQQYNASQDRVVVNVENQVDYESTIDKYLQLGVEERPEILLAPEFAVQTFAESASFVPVQACIEASGFDSSTFLPRALNAYAFDAVQWGLPFNVSSPVLYFTSPVFEAAGLDPTDPPLSLDELRSASQAIVDSGAATYGLVVDVARNSAGAQLEQWLGQAEVPFVDNDNGRSARATEALFDNPTGLRGFEFLQAMRRDGLSFNVGQNPGGLDAFLKLVDPSEPGAMTVETSAALTQLYDALDGGLGGDLTRDDLVVGPMPGPTDQPAAQVSGAALWIPADKGDESVAAAWDFTQFLVDAQTQSTWAAATGYVPMRSDAVELDPIASLFDDDTNFRVAYDQLAAPTDSPFAARPAVGPQREVRQALADAISRLYADPEGADAAALLADAEATANRLIATYNDLN